MYEVNVNGTKMLLNYSKAKKFVYQSTTSVYGRRMRENPATESTPYNPYSFYGKTKVMAEKLVMEKRGIIVRSPVIYGPGFNEGFQFVLSRIEKGKLPIIGKGDNAIQWIHINDLVQALLLVKERGISGETYLVAGGEAKTQTELFSLLAKCLGVDPPSKRVSEFMAVSMARYSEFTAIMTRKEPRITADQISRITSNRAFDITKARTQLGFNPKMDYAKGAIEMVREYLGRKDDEQDRT
jgi:nucleoside-diphosphate-sugar epimerase